MIRHRSSRASLAIAAVLTGLTFHLSWAQAIEFTRGDRVRERIVTPPAEPKRTGMAVTVVAQPGDTIEIRHATVLVNGQPIAGFSAELIAMAARSRHMPDRMRQDQYLIMGESRDPLNNVVRKWGVYSSRDLERAAD